MTMCRSTLLALFICLIGTASFSHADLADTIKRVRPAVVAVGTLHPTKSPRSTFLGSGFAVANGQFVVTNLHVLPERLDFARKESIAVFAGRGKQASIRRAEIVAKDTAHDLALLEIEGAPLPALLLECSATVEEGRQYAFTGFPIGMVLGLYPVTHQGIVSAITPIAIPSASSRNLTAKQIRRMKKPYDVFQLDAIAYPGNSGSPLYSVKSGAVVGVINSVFVKGTKESALSSPSGIAYAIPADHVRRLLKQAGVEP